jgi:hypothetical protein
MRLDSDISPSKKKNRKFTFKYHVIVRGVNVDVCKGCFLDIFCVSAKFIELCVQKKLSNTAGIVSRDNRGHSSCDSSGDLREAREHLESLPRYKSHYARNKTDKMFLANTATLKDLYEEYKRQCSGEPVSRWTYERLFHEMGLKIKPLKMDTCKTCDKLNTEIMHATSQQEKDSKLQQLELHHRMWEKAVEVKRQDKEEAREDNKKHVVAFDMQQCLPTPHLRTSVVFYKRQLWVYNCTIHDCGSKNSVQNMWHEGEGERGPNQIGSCLYYYIKELPDNVEELTLWSDTCSGQNKNSIVTAALATALSQKESLKLIDQKFLVPGHTHLECDSDHSIIEGKKRKAADIHVPRDWFTLVRNASPKFSVNRLTYDKHLDFKKFYIGRKSPLVKRKMNTAKEQFLWKDVVWIQHRADLPVGMVAYKTSLDKEAEFQYLDLRRKKKDKELRLDPGKAYDEPVKIAHKKKKDLLSLLHLIDPDCHSFYIDLKSDKEIDPDLDPDLISSCDEDDEECEEDNVFSAVSLPA